MKPIQEALELLGAYPPWAQVTAALGLIVTALTLLFAPRNTQAAAMTSVEVSAPREGETVSWSFPVTGTYQSVPDGSELWLMTTDRFGKRFWPQNRIIPRKDKTWAAEVNGIGGEPGTKRTFGVFVVGPDGQALLNLWQKAVRNDKKAFLEVLTRDIRPAAPEVAVILGEAKPQAEASTLDSQTQ